MSSDASSHARYDHVVIAVDGSDEAERAARRGLELARTLDATVDVVSVVERSSLGLARSADETGHLRERAEAALAEIEALASEVGQPVSTETTEGRPANRIAEFAAERDASVVVVGRQGRTGLGRRLLGGVTEKLLQRSEVPVLVVPGADASASEVDYSRLLVPTDGSETALAATRHGAAIARGYGSPLHVLNVVDLQAAGGPFDAGGLERSFVARLEEQGRTAVDDAASEVADAAPELDVETDVVRTTYQGAAAGIREYVEDADVDLVVVGSHGRTNLRRQLLGSVTSTLLRTVDVPVLVVPRAAQPSDS